MVGLLAKADGQDVPSTRQLLEANAAIVRDFAKPGSRKQVSAERGTSILNRYHYIDPTGIVPPDLLLQTLLYFDLNKPSFANQNYIAVVDFMPRSDHYRFYLINMQDGSVERFHTTHGTNSDEDNYARIFSNVVNSDESSLGYIRTGEVYYGQFDRSMRLDGLSPTNSNLRARAIVVHGFDGVEEANVIEPFTWGCIAFDWTVKDGIIDKLHDGALMYAGMSMFTMDF
jgi:hypothetical protein